jgi:hypothetical protein
MRNGYFLIFTSVLFCTPLRVRAAATLDTVSGKKNILMSQGEIMALSNNMSTSNALLRALRWLLEQTNCPANADTTRMPEVTNRAYGEDFLSPVPESNTRKMQ